MNDSKSNIKEDDIKDRFMFRLLALDMTHIFAFLLRNDMRTSETKKITNSKFAEAAKFETCENAKFISFDGVKIRTLFTKHWSHARKSHLLQCAKEFRFTFNYSLGLDNYLQLNRKIVDTTASTQKSYAKLKMTLHVFTCSSELKHDLRNVFFIILQ